MKKLVFLIIMSLLCNFSISTYSTTMVNPFYAIDSTTEYQIIKEHLKDNSHMYFQWGRLARNNNGIIQFTDKKYFSISPHDNRSEYGFSSKIVMGGSDFEYIVQPGDSLFAIGRKFEVPHYLISSYNKLDDPNSIRAGSIVKIPLVEPDLSSKEDYKNRFPIGKALFSIYFDATLYSDNKNAAIEFLNMQDDCWDKYIIQPIIHTLNNYEFDGVVLDFEAFRDSFVTTHYSNSQRTGLKEKYNRFLRKLKNELDDKLLVVIVHPTNVGGYFDGYHMAEIEKISDYIILMAYDYQYVLKYTASDNVPTALHGKVKTIESTFHNQPYVQPLWKVDEAVEELLKLVKNTDNIILGISIVGMKWVKYRKNIGGRNYYYYELYRPDLNSIESVNALEEYLENPAISKKIVPYNNISSEKRKELTRNGDEPIEIEYHFETPESLYIKYYNIVTSYNLSGIAIWRIGKGSQNTWNKLVNMFSDEENILPEPLPTPQPSSKNTQIILKIGEKHMTINGQIKEIDPGRDTMPVIIENRTLVPIRVIIESLGGNIYWYGEKNTVIIQYKETEIEMTIDSKIIKVGGTIFHIDVAPQIINDRTYIPLRFLLENLGFNVEWDSFEQKVVIDTYSQ
ncbi:UNVERIFIED_CONTAM: spore germination protein YaaH [Acetivibrio alkalicellulosi]